MSTKYFFSGGVKTANVAVKARGDLVFHDDDSSNTIKLIAPNSISSDVVLKLPANDGTSGQYLKTDGNGLMSWDTVVAAASAGGSDTQIQYNDAGAVAGTALLTFDDTDFLLGSATTTKLQFRDSGIYLNSSTDGTLNIVADGVVDVASDDITLLSDGNTGNVSLSAHGSYGTIALTTRGTLSQFVLESVFATAEDAIKINAGAGGIDIDAAAGKDINIAGGQVALVSKHNTASAISLTTNIGTTETIVVTNTQGTAEGAITLTATAGGVDVDAAASKDVNIAGGQVALVSKDDTASAISLTTNQGTSETIVVTNTQGTAEGAITLTATAGGVDINAAADKNVDVSGGQILLTSTQSTSNAVSLLTNTNTAETIEVTNVQGSSNAAIKLNAKAGGITFDTPNILYNVDYITVGTGDNVSATSAPGTAHNPVSSVAYLQVNTEADGNDFYWDLTGFGVDGQILNIFYDNSISTTTQLHANFGTNRLVSGSGNATSLIFDTNGQSATLICVYAGVNRNFNERQWRIINTGATVS